MKYKKTWIFIFLLAGAAVYFFVSHPLGDDDADSAGEESAVRQTVPVRVTEASEMTLPHRASHSGTIEPWEIAHVTGQSGQRIERVLVREGDHVRRGQVLVHMDDSNLRQAEVELRTARNELQRMQRLVEIGAVASQQLEQAEAHFETANSNVEMSRQNTHLSAPIAGVVTDKYFVAGEHFVAGAAAPSIMTIQQIDPLKVVINVSERYFPNIKPDMSATVRLDAYGDREFEGRVQRVNPTISVDSRTFRTEIRVDNADGLLSPGMSTRVILEMGEVTGQFLPRAALQTQVGTDESYVYVVEDNKARRVNLTTGERFEQHQRIISGLSEESLVVIEGMGRLSEGSPVRIVTDEQVEDEQVEDEQVEDRQPEPHGEDE